MNWFETYCSNTLGAGGNQTIFSTQGQEMKRDFAAIVRKLKGEGIRVWAEAMLPLFSRFLDGL